MTYSALCLFIDAILEMEKGRQIIPVVECWNFGKSQGHIDPRGMAKVSAKRRENFERKLPLHIAMVIYLIWPTFFMVFRTKQARKMCEVY